MVLSMNTPRPWTKRPNTWFVSYPCPSYRGDDKSLARPGRKQARKHVRDAHDFNNIETRAVIKFFLRQNAEGNLRHSDRNISLFPSWSGSTPVLPRIHHFPITSCVRSNGLIFAVDAGSPQNRSCTVTTSPVCHRNGVFKGRKILELWQIISV